MIVQTTTVLGSSRSLHSCFCFLVLFSTPCLLLLLLPSAPLYFCSALDCVSTRGCKRKTYFRILSVCSYPFHSCNLKCSLRLLLLCPLAPLLLHCPCSVLRSPSLLPCSISTHPPAERKAGPHVVFRHFPGSFQSWVVGLSCFFLGFGRCLQQIGL